MNRGIEKYIRENSDTIYKIIIIYGVGIAIGIVLFVFTNIKLNYVEAIRNVFDTTKLENYNGINIISNGIKNNAIYIAMLYMSLVTIIAPIIICLFVCIKAVITGIYMCSIISIFGFLKGIAVCLIGTIIPVIFSLSGYVIVCTNIMQIFDGISNLKKIEIKQVIQGIYYLIIALSLISLSIVVEQVMSGVCISIYRNIV